MANGSYSIWVPAVGPGLFNVCMNDLEEVMGCNLSSFQMTPIWGDDSVHLRAVAAIIRDPDRSGEGANKLHEIQHRQMQLGSP